MTDHNAPASRRRFLWTSAGLAATLPAWIASCTNDPGSTKPADDGARKKEQDAHDAELLNKGIAMEQGAVNVYRAAAKLDFLQKHRDIIKIASMFGDQHEGHRDALSKWIKELGGAPMDPGEAPTPELPPAILNAALDEEERRKAVLAFARALEKKAADAYFELISKNLLTDFARRSALEILPIEAQHVTVFDMVLGRDDSLKAAFYPDET